MMDNDDIPLPSSQEIHAQTKEFKKRVEALVESLKPQAAMLKGAFDSLLREGFTQEQALKIVCARGYTLGGD